MIDIHSHILPGLDDGAGDLAESLAMARVAVADGVEEIVATPHSSISGAVIEAATESGVQQRVQQFREALAEAGIPLRVCVGLEVWLTPGLLSARRAGRAFPINGGCYMLIELPAQMIPNYVEQTIFGLQVAGLRPILAHPERNREIERKLDLMYDLVGRGVLGQVTAGSLLGSFGGETKRLAEMMLTHNLVHVIASDAHSAEHRPPALAAAAKRAAELIGQERANAMVTTVPRSIVAGQPIDTPEPLPLQRKRRWLLWGG